MVIIWHQPKQGTIIGEIHQNYHIIIKMSLCLVMLSMKSPVGNESTTVEWATLDTIDVTFVAQINQAFVKRQNGFSVICPKKADFVACFWGLELMWNQYSHASWAKPAEGNCPFWTQIHHLRFDALSEDLVVAGAWGGISSRCELKFKGTPPLRTHKWPMNRDLLCCCTFRKPLDLFDHFLRNAACP